MFDNPGIFYSNNLQTIFNNNWLLDPLKIKKLKQNKLSVLDFSSEHHGTEGLDYVYHVLDNNEINFLLLVHDPADHKKFDRMIFYPHWYHWARKNFIFSDNNTNKKKYTWGCLNGNPRPHRIYNYIYSQQQEYFKSACFSFYNADNGARRPDDVILSPDVVEVWNKIKSTLPHRNNINIGPRADSLCNLPAITDSYIHLVSETTVIPKIFVSEKTWKPIAAGQLFLIFGNVGIVQYLRNQGVDVFDDIIDHSYDLISNWQQRLHLAHKQLKHLIDQDLDDIYIATQTRRLTNVEKFFSGAFDQQYSQTLLQCINTLS